jgi:Putative prokaryotic signal transducing protein
MTELFRTHDVVLISYVRSLLSSEGIDIIGLDENMNNVRLVLTPQRVMVDDNDAERARRLLKDAGLGHVFKS